MVQRLSYVENFRDVGIWGEVQEAFLMEAYSLNSRLGVGSWFIGTFCYEAALNHVNKGTIYKPVDYKWHILGYDIQTTSGKSHYTSYQSMD